MFLQDYIEQGSSFKVSEDYINQRLSFKVLQDNLEQGLSYKVSPRLYRTRFTV